MICIQNIIVDGYEVTASFSPVKNTDAIRQVKQILLSTFIAKSNRTFANISKECNNSTGSSPYAP